MKLRHRVARLESAHCSHKERLAVVFPPRESDPDYLFEQTRIEALKAAGRTLIVIDDMYGRHERWAGSRRIE